MHGKSVATGMEIGSGEAMNSAVNTAMNANASSAVDSLAARLFVVLVLYKRSPEQSEAFTSLRDVLAMWPAARERVECLIYDNSPEEHVVPAVSFRCGYASDVMNRGLALAYNVALERATVAGATWLLLLDHDTLLTREYLEEVLSAIDNVGADHRVTAIVPKLVQAGTVLSPQWPVPSSRKQSEPVPLDFAGMSKKPLQVFSSGAVLRVADLAGIGGFDESFSHECLDHATFRALQERGGQVLVLHACLPHELSLSAGWGDPGFQHRFWSFMEAEHRYKRRFAKGSELLWHYFWRGWLIVGRVARGQFGTAYRHLKIVMT